MNANKRESFIPDDAFPFHFGLLEVDEQADCGVGGSKIVETLRHVVVSQPVYTFNFNE